jgi:hypothetical protein
MNTNIPHEIAATAARLVVEEGMEYGPAKRRAAKELGLSGRHGCMPSNDQLEEEVRAYLALFCADTQGPELDALRQVAQEWMVRLAEFRPHLSGAVWRGTATRHNDIHLQLFCDDSKSAEIALLNGGIDYEVSSVPGPRAEPVDVLSVSSFSQALGERVWVHLKIMDHDDLRGALKPDAGGQTSLGDLNSLRKRMEAP